MAVTLNNIANREGARKRRMVVGRGIGSGKGKTSGRGVKGQKARTGVSINGFEGGQQPLHRRLPKRGFNNYNRKELEVVNLGQLQKLVDEKKLDKSKTVNLEALRNAGVVGTAKDGVKLLGKGELKTALTIEVTAASESVAQALEKAGGKLILPKAKPENEQAKKSAAKKAAKQQKNGPKKKAETTDSE